MAVLFPLGTIVMTPGAADIVQSDTAGALLRRHVSGDWGTMDDEDKAANDQAVRDGARILSAYAVDGQEVWIITESDRSVTTLLLPSEY